MSDHFISLAQAKAMTARYRAEKENILKPEYQGKDLLPICETFDRDGFDAVLAQKGAVALRVYFGMTENLQVRVIVVGVDADNKDILPSGGAEASVGADDDEGLILDEGRVCPPSCPVPPL